MKPAQPDLGAGSGKHKKGRGVNETSQPLQNTELGCDRQCTQQTVNTRRWITSESMLQKMIV